MLQILPRPKRLDFEHAIKEVGLIFQRDPAKMQQLTELVQNKTVTYGGVKGALETLGRADFSKTPAYFRKGLSALVPSVISFLEKIGSKPEMIDMLKNLASHTGASHTGASHTGASHTGASHTHTMKKIGGRRRRQTLRKNQKGGNRIATIMTMIIFLVTICQMSSAFQQSSDVVERERQQEIENFRSSYCAQMGTCDPRQNDILPTFNDKNVPTVNTQLHNVAVPLPPPYLGDFGTVVINENESYIGNRLNGLYHGYGELRKDGNVYTTNFVNGTSGNLGKIEFKNGELYVGEIKDLEPYGDGVYIKDGVVYQGNFRKEGDFLVGIGEFSTPEYDYKGQFRNGVPHGFGEKIFCTKVDCKWPDKILHGYFKHGSITGVGSISKYPDGIRYTKVYNFRNGKITREEDPRFYENTDNNIHYVQIAVSKSLYNVNINYENAIQIAQEFLNQEEAEHNEEIKRIANEIKEDKEKHNEEMKRIANEIKEDEEKHNEEMKRIANEIKKLEIKEQKAKEVRRNYMTKIAQQSKEEEKNKTINTMKALEKTITDLNDEIGKLKIRQSEILQDLQASHDQHIRKDKAFQESQAQNAKLQTQQSETDAALQKSRAENADLINLQGKTSQELLDEIDDKKRELGKLNSMYEKSLDEIKLLKAVEPVQVTRSQPSVPNELQGKVIYAADNIAFPLLIVIFAALFAYKKNASRIQFIKDTEKEYTQKLSENESEFDAIDTVVDDDKNFYSRSYKYNRMIELLNQRLGFMNVQLAYYTMYDEKEKMSAMGEKVRSTKTLLDEVTERKDTFVKSELSKLYEQIALLEEEIASLKEDKKLEISKRDEQIASLKEDKKLEISKRDEQIASLKEEKKAIVDQYKDSTTKFQSQKKDLDKLVDSLYQKLNSSKTTTSSLQNDILTLKKTFLKEQEEHKTDIKHLTTEVQKLRTTNLKNLSNIRNLEIKIGDARSDLSKKTQQYQFKVAVMKGLLQKLKQELEEKNKATEKIDSMREADEKKIERLEKEIKDMETGFQAKIKEQDREISELNDKVLRETQEVERQRKELESKPGPSAISDNKLDIPTALVVEEDTRFAKYRKMLNTGVPEVAVLAKMRNEGFNEEDIKNFTNPTAAAVAPVAQVDERFEQYMKMRKTGIPEPAIRHKMNSSKNFTEAEVDNFFNLPIPKTQEPADASTSKPAGLFSGLGNPALKKTGIKTTNEVNKEDESLNKYINQYNTGEQIEHPKEAGRKLNECQEYFCASKVLNSIKKDFPNNEALVNEIFAKVVKYPIDMTLKKTDEFISKQVQLTRNSSSDDYKKIKKEFDLIHSNSFGLIIEMYKNIALYDLIIPFLETKGDKTEKEITELYIYVILKKLYQDYEKQIINNYKKISAHYFEFEKLKTGIDVEKTNEEKKRNLPKPEHAAISTSASKNFQNLNKLEEDLKNIPTDLKKLQEKQTKHAKELFTWDMELKEKVPEDLYEMYRKIFPIYVNSAEKVKIIGKYENDIRHTLKQMTNDDNIIMKPLAKSSAVPSASSSAVPSASSSEVSSTSSSTKSSKKTFKINESVPQYSVKINLEPTDNEISEKIDEINLTEMFDKRLLTNTKGDIVNYLGIVLIKKKDITQEVVNKGYIERYYGGILISLRPTEEELPIALEKGFTQDENGMLRDKQQNIVNSDGKILIPIKDIDTPASKIDIETGYVTLTKGGHKTNKKHRQIRRKQKRITRRK